ncbi:hypothetical protein I79_026197 [Cricetulus griseus]|uniref:Uncharacterized protein n=1 Tax=Cricetulus griseus TaxID=10029 RepID=G3IQ95_CRIGR|nr:hypothetical protein I79_026197 [Cricetulus griseus]
MKREALVLLCPNPHLKIAAVPVAESQWEKPESHETDDTRGLEPIFRVLRGGSFPHYGAEEMA